MKIIFDLDHTLLSTGKFYRLFENRFRKLGVRRDIFRATFEGSKDRRGNYRSARHFRLLFRQTRIPVPKFRREFWKVLGRLDRFLYPDVLPFFRKIKGKADLFLLSYGNKRFQREKIQRMKINKNFRKIFVTEDVNKVRPLKKIMKKREKAFFVDDNPGALFRVKRFLPDIVTVRVRRGEGRYRGAPDNKNVDFAVKNLRELARILRKNYGFRF